ncbi:MAG: helix-turn-helix domain-containing protein [Humidesulfovibrio sp.]
MAEAESSCLRQLLAATGGDIPKACAVSGLSRARLYALLKTYGLSWASGLADVAAGRFRGGRR